MQAHIATTRHHIKTAIPAMVTACVLMTAAAQAQRFMHDVPPDTEGIGIEERLDETITLDLPFVDHHGRNVTIGDYLEPGKPMILTLNYYHCPQLCHMTLNGLVQGLNEVEWTVGREFRIVTVSIDPDEEPADAASFDRAYRSRYQREIPEDGWAFLVGDERHVKQLAEEVGFQYRYVPETGEYAHPSTIIFITPDGRIARYINHFFFEPRDLRLSLVESSEGKIGTRTDRLMLFLCYEYDPDAGTYVMAAWKIMRAGGALTVLFLAVGLIVLWLKGSRYQSGEAERDGGRKGELALTGGNP